MIILWPRLALSWPVLTCNPTMTSLPLCICVRSEKACTEGNKSLVRFDKFTIESSENGNWVEILLRGRFPCHKRPLNSMCDSFPFSLSNPPHLSLSLTVWSDGPGDDSSVAADPRHRHVVIVTLGTLSRHELSQDVVCVREVTLVQEHVVDVLGVPRLYLWHVLGGRGGIQGVRRGNTVLVLC